MSYDFEQHLRLASAERQAKEKERLGIRARLAEEAREREAKYPEIIARIRAMAVIAAGVYQESGVPPNFTVGKKPAERTYVKEKWWKLPISAVVTPEIPIKAWLLDYRATTTTTVTPGTGMGDSDYEHTESSVWGLVLNHDGIIKEIGYAGRLTGLAKDENLATLENVAPLRPLEEQPAILHWEQRFTNVIIGAQQSGPMKYER